MPSTAFERARLGLRALNYVSYMGSSLLRGLAGPRPDLVLCMTDPPMVGDVGLAIARRFRVPLLVISEDVFPEIATQLGRLDNRLLVSSLRRMVGLYLKRADRVVAIGDTMRQPARGERCSRRSSAGDPQLGRHGDDRAAATGQRVGPTEQA